MLIAAQFFSKSCIILHFSVLNNVKATVSVFLTRMPGLKEMENRLFSC